MKNSYSVIKIEWSIKFIRCILKLLPLQGASLIALYPGRCLGLRASAPSGRAAYMGFCPFRALQLIWAFGPSGRCCPMQISQNFRAVWLKLPSTPFCMVEITQHALLYGWNYPACPSVRLKLPYTPFCMVEISLHALLYGWIYPACPSVRLKLPYTPFCMVEITQHALKGQKLLAQGSALGYIGSQPNAL